MEANEKRNANLHEDMEDDVVDFDALEEQLESELEEKLVELKFLESEKEQIGNPDALGETIKSVIWEQFLNQIAVTAGEDFIEENRGLTLDLRSEAHIQTTEHFANGRISSHNTEIDYQQRYDDWQSNFAKDENGIVSTHTTKSGKEKATLVKGARKPFDEGRPSGSTERGTDMDHTVSAAEIIRDPAANAHMTRENQIAFANSEKNLNEMESSLNKSKGDKSTTEWLDTPNANGQKPNEIFDISHETDKQLRKKETEAREEYEKQKRKGEEKSIKTGKESQRKEAFRVGGMALRAVAMQLLAEFVKEIIFGLVKWLKDKQRSLESLIDSIRAAIKSFVGKLKTHLVNAGNTLVTTIATTILGPVVRTIKKVWIMLKQGWKSLREAITFLKDPANRSMPFSTKILEVGKIVMAGLSGVGALVLGEVIEKGLMTIPIFAVEIPLLGSLANIVGIFIGAVVAGIIGAIAINLIDRAIAKRRKAHITENQVEKGNDILNKQRELYDVTAKKYIINKEQIAETIKTRHKEAAVIMKESVDEIFSSGSNDNSVDFEFMDAALDDLDK